MAKIKNIKNNVPNNCTCNSWLNHWGNYNAKPAVFCSEIRCTQMFHLQGAHVQKEDDDENWYIVPLCEDHVTADGELEINDFIHFVPAIKLDSCD